MASIAETQKRIADYKELRDNTIEALKALTKVGDIEQYSFGDGNGNQSVRRRRISELQKALADYERQIDDLESSLQGGGIMTFGTNRYGRG